MVAAVVSGVRIDGVFRLEDRVRHETAGVLARQPVEHSRSLVPVATIRASLSFARCWDTAAEDLPTTSAR